METRPQDTKVIVGMSGGVDSSVAALLLQQQGYQVEGLFMKNWEEDDGTEYCTAKVDLADAEAVCERLGIHLHTANFAAEYWDGVFEHFLHEYQAGRTPNPDILCNREIKFKAFLEYALELGADFIATGHYARRGERNGQSCLLKGLDNNKDQSYFLSAVNHESLSRSLFPVGELDKTEVRQIATENNFVTSDKKDSTGICFIGERKFKDFLQQYLPAQPGDIETTDGERIGHHQGLMYHTYGQRQGLGIGGHHAYPEAPWYVVGKDLERNVLLVAQGNDHPALFSSQLKATQVHWINEAGIELPLRCHAKIRYRQPDQACLVEDRDGNGTLTVSFDSPQRAVTPGQTIVFYDQDICLGGAVIESYQR
ncbi:tRNA 2-thiouridine(34) synthase MnmA [Pseudohongiella nitratireducens]|uniref:tRNA 2-thiouridine(34) synthase MnmA n=1 Tax=Pseudohongiella nitratireducens TaxID=1768907 RepID=UPI002409E9F1|nr:tRNA 2-thiouridine(34) synthase MnmA [Pseudohongiella nitratireducens]MDF1622820.1 tRNA 2-thiouridine(34) synthase MnmA [Pseudohongiella nitratireducens]|tara:strand:+ start:512 stop:1615 length:1104 start_codon:yes stop_codon:yes gene_type:complete